MAVGDSAYFEAKAGFAARLRRQLAEARRQSLYRTRIPLQSGQGVSVLRAGRRLINFSSNDYLGLAGHPRLGEALQAGVRRYGLGSGASQLLSGYSEAHHELEQRLAELTGYPRCLCFSSGYMANLAAVTALVDPGDRIIADRYAHASLLDAAVLSRARLQRHAHADPAALSRCLQDAEGRASLVLTEGVFSMDGDTPPLARIAEICRHHGAWLLVDDAHGFGICGDRGAGTLDALQLGPLQVQILIGAFGKACGIMGAFVAGPEDLIETLIQRGRTLIYTTAPPPALAVATLEALDLLREEGWRRQRLQQNIAWLQSECARRGITLAPSGSPVQPVPLQTAARALAVSEALLQAGLLVPAVRPPTVPQGQARLRISVSALHEPEQLLQLVQALEQAL